MSLTGQTAPDFALFNTSKTEVSLSGLRGQKVVLAFFPAAFTGVCEKELCTFRNGLADMNAVGGTVLGISVDSPFANKAFAAKNEINFPLLSDYTRSTVNAYGIAFDNFAGMDGYVAANRAVFVVDESGTVIYEWVAPTLGTEPDYAAVQAALA
jgi:peroxiredoxin